MFYNYLIIYASLDFPTSETDGFDAFLSTLTSNDDSGQETAWGNFSDVAAPSTGDPVLDQLAAEINSGAGMHNWFDNDFDTATSSWTEGAMGDKREGVNPLVLRLTNRAKVRQQVALHLIQRMQMNL